MPLDLNKSILIDQRNLMYPYDALCKTCIVSIPTHWSPGFHFCSSMPRFHDLFLLHMKLADIPIQIAIGAMVAQRSDEPRIQNYHRTPREDLELRLRVVRNYPREKNGMGSLYRELYLERFVTGFSYTDTFQGIFHGSAFIPEEVLISLPVEFKGLL